MSLLVAIGGNAVHPDNIRGTTEEQETIAGRAAQAALLARSLDIPDLLILTAVERIAIDYDTPRQSYLDRITASELRAHQRAGHFAKGSMGPKVEAALRHLAGGGRRAIIGHLDRAAAALAGASGTHVVAD